ncbi:MAG: CBS domain-containing protein [Brevinematales bacterium]|nr:CBS domain-containing protein [Brevinematales bacterium]
MPRRKSTSDFKKLVFNYLSNIHAGEMVLPRPHVITCYADSTPDEVLSTFKKYMYSRIPLVDRKTDKIIGYIFYKDFCNKYIETKGKFNIIDVKREILFIPENMNAMDIMNEMKNKFTNIAIVVDEYGNHIGIITLEDIVEKILGELLDETDNKEDEEFEVQKINDGEYLVSAWAPIEDIALEIGMEIDKDILENMDVRTIVGFIMYISGNIPRYNSTYEYKDFLFKVVEIENNRPSKILIRRK